MNSARGSAPALYVHKRSFESRKKVCSNLRLLFTAVSSFQAVKAAG